MSQTITFEGSPKQDVVTIITWFTKEYLELFSYLIHFEFKDLKSEGVWGWCMRGDEDTHFHIQIEHSLVGDDLRKTVLHELYHVRQYLMGVDRCETCAHLSEEFNLNRFNEVDTYE